MKMNGRVGLGIIVRDAAGNVLASSAQRVLAGFSIESAEAMAVCKGLLFAEDSGLLPVLVETDALVVVNFIKSGRAPLSDVGLIIDDILRFLDRNPSCKVAFVPIWLLIILPNSAYLFLVIYFCWRRFLRVCFPLL
ncbi:hypothetical protein Dsin_024136 [Dipteronia sinensis]|uniref:RNase H type-1 domain-containing protein n=1 Tax=Dipteronia sinensis TaxID=43782 RepID=A0AAE0A681_9ROSI|nr:hypothetical protein Dsin_024136 [Dipteronia sinensis]